MKIQLRNENIEKIIANRIIFWLVIFSIVNIASFFPTENIFIDLISHFRIQYIAIIFIFFVTFILFVKYKRIKKIGSILLSILLICNVYELNPYLHKPVYSNNNKGVKIGVYNVLTENNNYNLFLEELKRQKPDIAIVLEVNDKWIENIKTINKYYEYSLECPSEDNFGIALYSKLPLKNQKIEYWSDYAVPVIKADISIRNQIFTLYCVHTLPPTNKEYLLARNTMLKNIASKINNKEKIIVAGDFNTTIFSHIYKNTIKKEGGIDAQSQQSEIKGTWTTKFPEILRITLDHIIVSKNIQIQNYNRGNKIGSDHFPIYATLQLN